MHKERFRAIRVAILGGLTAAALLFCPFSQAGVVLDPESTINNLEQPKGMAVHPQTGETYICEEGANRVSVIRDGHVIPVIDKGWQWLDDIPSWAIHNGKTREMMQLPLLRNPLSIAFSEDGHMFVTEKEPYSRIIEFVPTEDGVYSAARFIPVPWLRRDFSWHAVQVAEDGRLFLAGSTYGMGPGLHFGTVLMRDLDEDWWVVDYGPFNSFNALALSRDQDILVVLDEFSGVVTWWDTVRQKVVGTSNVQLPNANAMSVLTDGSIIVSHEDKRRPGLSRLIRINPDNDRSELVASGLQTPHTMLFDPDNDTLLVSNPEQNSISTMLPGFQLSNAEYLLNRSLYTFEMTQGIAPKKWPKFMKNFVKELGVVPTDETMYEDGRDPDSKKETANFTVREFTQRIPMIAGRVKIVSEDILRDREDPVNQIDFVVFYPGRAVQQGPNATPSLSLFSATHDSGRIERTKVINGYKAMSFSDDQGWNESSEQAYLYFPMASCTATRQPNGVDISLAFLGMGFSEDFYLDLECGQNDRGKLVIDGQNGTVAEREIQFTEKDETGEEVRNIMVAGLNIMDSEPYTWLKIGKKPSSTQLDLSQNKDWMSFRTAKYKGLLEDKAGNYRVMGMEDIAVRAAEKESVADDEPLPYEEYNNPQPFLEHDGLDFDVDAINISETDEEYQQRLEQAWTNIMLARAIEAWAEMSYE